MVVQTNITSHCSLYTYDHCVTGFPWKTKILVVYTLAMEVTRITFELYSVYIWKTLTTQWDKWNAHNRFHEEMHLFQGITGDSVHKNMHKAYIKSLGREYQVTLSHIKYNSETKYMKLQCMSSSSECIKHLTLNKYGTLCCWYLNIISESESK